MATSSLSTQWADCSSTMNTPMFSMALMAMLAVSLTYMPPNTDTSHDGNSHIAIVPRPNNTVVMGVRNFFAEPSRLNTSATNTTRKMPSIINSGIIAPN